VVDFKLEVVSLNILAWSANPLSTLDEFNKPMKASRMAFGNERSTIVMRRLILPIIQWSGATMEVPYAEYRGVTGEHNEPGPGRKLRSNAEEVTIIFRDPCVSHLSMLEHGARC